MKLAYMIVNNLFLFFSLFYFFCIYCYSLCFKFLILFRDGQCPEYTGEEQAICAVGLVKSKPGIFVEAIQYLLVLATPVEVGLLLSIFTFLLH